MSENLKCVIFDFDGVLADSLEAHLQFCRDYAKEIEEHVDIPESVDAFKENMIATGKIFNPMKNFMMAVGFTKKQAEEGNESYKNTFHKKYKVSPFENVDTMLQRLRERGLKLGIVSANYRNVIDDFIERCGLQDSQGPVFSEDVLFAKKDGDKSDLSKSGALKRIAADQCITPRQILYVGDQHSDYKAAQEAGVCFLGVSYGWGFFNEPAGIRFAKSVPDIANRVFSLLRDSTDSVEAKKLQLEHGREMFLYHAGQRNTSIRYYLLAIAILSVAVTGLFSVADLTPITLTLTLFVGLTATIISLSFWGLDHRNQAIVDGDEKLLNRLERELANECLTAELKTIEHSDLEHQGWLVSYGQIMPLIFIFSALSGLALALASLWYGLGTGLSVETPSTVEFSSAAISLILLIISTVGVMAKVRLKYKGRKNSKV